MSEQVFIYDASGAPIGVYRDNQHAEQPQRVVDVNGADVPIDWAKGRAALQARADAGEEEAALELAVHFGEDAPVDPLAE